MTQADRRISEAVRALENMAQPPSVGVVLGSGLGGFTEEIDRLVCIAGAQIPHFPVGTVEGHEHCLCFGSVGTVPVACLKGRVHLYEGYGPDQVVFGVRLLAGLGCRTVLLTNAAGGIAKHLEPGDLMLITDHLNLTGQNPLVSRERSSDRRFVDLSTAYDPGVTALGERAAQACGTKIHRGVYAGLVGPSYETPAEVRMLARLGADAVGMSTVLEVIALVERGVRVGAVSLITNRAAGTGPERLEHAEVLRVASSATSRMVKLLKMWILLIGDTALLRGCHVR